ncbi:MAG TPA: hypothetical protein QGF63_09260 [Alphaproteobacteria bacterium]|jgi:hypothetical protein|nr:hypothetical protein [Alphaproteobacteria bacterium]MDP6270637.1 hypothetical protein [Alphaproteobacteria bacterium]MDP7164938.1 hypothetical protein [Alphaproteobacteria bacterium]MDP7429278.1 hypothetical protein [Alphaproteobacteria bacterium]HJM50023.1 hypothetical protein [Alphaproteobacteria bacterium]|tara:strand:+ start:838 stop:1011 length:174 start_codon:yes stop_codon:yes gene_type:complete
MLAQTRSVGLAAVALSAGLLTMWAPELFVVCRDLLGYLLDTYFLVFLDSETSRFLCF